MLNSRAMHFLKFSGLLDFGQNLTFACIMTPPHIKAQAFPSRSRGDLLYGLFERQHENESFDP